MNYSHTRVLVTGADGFIGSHLVEHLHSLGAEITALAQYNSFDTFGWLDDVPKQVLRELRVERGDIRDRAYIFNLAKGQDIIFHLAALIGIPYSYQASQSYVDVNITGTLNILEAARYHNCPRVVQTSTSEVYGNALYEPIDEAHPLQGQSPYSASKIGADMIASSFALSFELPIVILRPFNTYGPRQSERAVIPTVIRQAIDDQCSEIRLGDINTRRDFNFVTDTTSAFATVGLSEGLDYGIAYNAGTGVSVTIQEMVTEVCNLTHCDKQVVQEEARQRPEASEIRTLLADASRLQKATGWRAKHDLRTGLQFTIDWWRDHLATGSVRSATSFMV